MIEFPEWVIRKEGTPILFENKWQSTIGFKWGTLLTGAGTGGSVAKNTDHYYGGNGVDSKGSVAMTTHDITDSVAEIKTTMPRVIDGKVAFEMKWIAANSFGANELDFGIEPRTQPDDFWQGRLRYDIANDEWRYESSQDVYTSFAEKAIVPEPNIDAAAGLSGDLWGWARLIIDTIKKEYVTFEFAGKDGIEARDMRGIGSVNRGAVSDSTLLFFVLGIAGASSNQTFYTTDWCISKV